MNESLSINKNVQKGSRNLPHCSPYCGKSIPVSPWPNRTHGYFGKQHPSDILLIYDRSGV